MACCELVYYVAFRCVSVCCCSLYDGVMSWYTVVLCVDARDGVLQCRVLLCVCVSYVVL